MIKGQIIADTYDSDTDIHELQIDVRGDVPRTSEEVIIMTEKEHYVLQDASVSATSALMFQKAKNAQLENMLQRAYQELAKIPGKGRTQLMSDITAYFEGEK